MSISTKKQDVAADKPATIRAKGRGTAMEPEIINSTELRAYTRDYMERVKYNGEIFLVETFGRPMAVIMSVEDFHFLRDLIHPVSSMQLTRAKTKKTTNRMGKQQWIKSSERSTSDSERQK